ncbi:MAG: N-acetylmuramoyl-L-alanine amidase [Pelagibacteraceae bacterium]|jgi:N-acetylmuramoyl-L-alanine amidase|nr:N-acetylmuramoyl-L-alanine amidase [Pelagibacteraceae bacterium]MDP6784576.1 N-acetylmuramoyl-L-alanine amidase [Alphaproteobacteria bacterium]MBO6466526.1 N-acetylmuramoyl-L-alanine amidase [Pelagibacteraceae bacterium]MBO6467390.1 N-acetylmuramoyl-L-alanine amidase [Pelagibacteraceae bacterium]MBO6469226.1 N-acetylmuramoyl-L-alanine amidase [Pelagibacteraceae bacterium]
MKFIEKYKSLSFGIRKKDSSLNYIIIHYSAIKSYKEALSYLSERKNKVSSHFFINKSGEIFYLVDLKNRAWHAGRSYWKGIIDINSESIGIEMDNSGHHYDFENYNPKQIKSLIRLLKYISKRFNINKQNVLGHSDISPYRKIDPGERFPWKKLNKNNLSFLPNKLLRNKKNKIERYLEKKIDNRNKKYRLLYMLNKIGYDIRAAKKDKKKYYMLIKAYQMHYRQSLVSGKLDLETYNLILSHYNEVLTKG